MDCLALLPEKNASVGQYQQSHRRSYDQLIILLNAARQVARRLKDDEILEVASGNLVIKGDDTTEKIRSRIEMCLDALVIYEMDAHFINEADNEEFEIAIVPNDEKEQIRYHLNFARDLASVADFLTDPVRRSFLLKISKAESELFKEKVGMQAFFAAAYEGSRLLRRFGEDAQPLADAVEKARTKTELHVEGSVMLEVDEKPKQIEGPKM